MGSDQESKRTHRDGESGTVVVLVAGAMGAILIMVALVLDLGGARRDKEIDQLAADAMALAAAGNMGESVTDARRACQAAWDYLVVNLPTDVTAPSESCASLASACTSGVARQVVTTIGVYRVTFTHPVPNGHALLSGQASSSLDGAACDRFGVRVEQSRANLWAEGEVALDVDAVSRFIRGVGDVDAPLVLLAEHACEVLTVNGTGVLTVTMSTGEPGYIDIDSDGSACSNPNKVVLDVDGKGTISAGVISMWALADGDPTSAYSSGLVTPTPTASSAPVGRTGMDWRYNCSPDNHCPGPGPAHIDDLVAKWGGPGDPPAAEGFTRWTPTYSCNPTGTTVVPAGNWYINCGTSGISTNGSITFQGGNVVSDGPIRATGSGGVRINCGDGDITDSVAPATCLTDPAAPTIFFQRSGDLIRNGSLELRETFVYLATGTVDMAGSAKLTWTAPDDPDHPFDDLLLWTESSTPIGITGNTDFKLDGILFAPNAAMSLSGNTGGQAIGAQIFAKSVDIAGTANLTLSPRADRILQVGKGRPILIR